MTRRIIAIFVRHGETTFNVGKIIQGHTNTPLSELGMQQAELLGKAMSQEKFSAVYSSDLSRALTTCQLILKHSPNSMSMVPAIDTRLRERHYGTLEGKHIQFYIDEANRAGVQRLMDYTPEKAETSGELTERAASFLKELLNKTVNDDRSNTENILVVSHGGWIRSLMYHVSENDQLYSVANFEGRALQIMHNTGVMQMTFTKEETAKSKWDVNFNRINDWSHLKSLQDEKSENVKL